jgi:hypothetical protein
MSYWIIQVGSLCYCGPGEEGSHWGGTEKAVRFFDESSARAVIEDRSMWQAEPAEIVSPDPKDTRIATLEAENKRLREALEPFANAAENVPDDQEDFKILAYVPGGHHARSYEKLAKDLTAGNFRAARAALQGTEEGS